MNNIDSASLVADRQNRENSAVYLNGGCAQIPSDSVSWIGDYSQTVWVNVRTLVRYSKLLNCGIKLNYEMIWTLNWMSNQDVGNSIQISSMSEPAPTFDTTPLTGTGWTHLAIVQSGTEAFIYRLMVL